MKGLFLLAALAAALTVSAPASASRHHPSKPAGTTRLHTR
jgi:hypothetical protein